MTDQTTQPGVVRSKPSQSPSDKDDLKCVRDAQKSPKRRRLARLVSQDEAAISSAVKDSASFRSYESSKTGNDLKLDFSNPLNDSGVRDLHIYALRLEVDLNPMRLILSRLMAHPTYNRKGLFNQPVDPIALKLPDYNQIVKKPMDLGTIKRRLHTFEYSCRDHVADDIRLVFINAIQYNPPHNVVHQCAKELLINFEASYSLLDQCVSSQRTREVEETTTAPGILSGDFARSALSNSEEKAISSGAAMAPSTHCKPASFSISNHPSIHNSVPRVKSKSRSLTFLPHSCQSCKGRKCALCNQGCLSHEPSLMVCQGYNCGGAKIRKGAQYFISGDGNRHFCQKCYVNLSPILPGASDTDAFRYKQDLLKRKNDEEIPERWIDCSLCSSGVHAVCALHNGYVHDASSFVCPGCVETRDFPETPITTGGKEATSEYYTFLSGAKNPVPFSFAGSSGIAAESLPKCSISSFIEEKVRQCMKVVPNSDKTITVRVLSNCSRHFVVPEVVRRHFRMPGDGEDIIDPPAKVKYQQKAIALFQKIDGLDVCIYCMYVQEYDGDDMYENRCSKEVTSSHKKRVYIAYIDSVEHFRPRQCRTQVYQEILVSYLATARQRGYETAQIWACPPSRGNNFVFWNHPSSQKTPTKERLISWYHATISRAVDCGVITDVKSLYETDFQGSLTELEKSRIGEGKPSSRMLCPPLLDGDFWIEEAVRVHQTNLSRNLKIRSPTEVCVWNVSTFSAEDLNPCPALQLATLIKDRVMTHPSSVHFRRPVNAASLKLKNYHKIVKKPMDLGTIYSKCVLGEYNTLADLVNDVNLMVVNAKTFNPVGHFVHVKANEVLELFENELNSLVKFWKCQSDSEASTWESYEGMSMSLDETLEIPSINTVSAPTSVVIEDDRSSDGSRSLASSISISSAPASPSAVSGQLKEDEYAKPPSRRRSLSMSSKSKKMKPLPQRKNLDLLSDGPDAVMHYMVGDDVWLLDKRNSGPPKGNTSNKKSNSKRRRSLSVADVSICEPLCKRRRQSWLGEEVGDSVRGMRTSFFTCSLAAKPEMSEKEQEKVAIFSDYSATFDTDFRIRCLSSPIVDARSSLLEFSQFRNLEFDTLRRAKYSTAVLLHHLKNASAPGVVPPCTTCERDIKDIRWHKVNKAPEKRRLTKILPPKATNDPNFEPEELCASCYSLHLNQSTFIPIPVSIRLHSE